MHLLVRKPDNLNAKGSFLLLVRRSIPISTTPDLNLFLDICFNNDRSGTAILCLLFHIIGANPFLIKARDEKMAKTPDAAIPGLVAVAVAEGRVAKSEQERLSSLYSIWIRYYFQLLILGLSLF